MSQVCPRMSERRIDEREESRYEYLDLTDVVALCETVRQSALCVARLVSAHPKRTAVPASLAVFPQ